MSYALRGVIVYARLMLRNDLAQQCWTHHGGVKFIPDSSSYEPKR